MKEKSLELRPEVEAFAQLMERELRKNDYKNREDGSGSWKDDSAATLITRLIEEVAELVDSFSPLVVAKRPASTTFNRHWYDITSYLLAKACDAIRDIEMRPDLVDTTINEAVDIANFAMFVVDVLGGLKASGKKGPKQG